MYRGREREERESDTSLERDAPELGGLIGLEPPVLSCVRPDGPEARYAYGLGRASRAGVCPFPSGGQT